MTADAGSDAAAAADAEPVAVAVALELDARGLLCPAPIIMLGRRAGQVPVGAVIAVVAEDVAARYDVPAWCRMLHHTYLGEDTAPDGVPRYLVRREQ